MTAVPERRRLGPARLALCAGFLLLSWGIYAYGAFHSPLLNAELAERKAYLDRIIREGRGDFAEERRLAELYWTRYPDVAADRYFGRDGAMGAGGAREHYERHGKREGRKWGE